MLHRSHQTIKAAVTGGTRHFWAPGYFSTTSGNITDDVILQYLGEHETTGVSR
jgi:REP element-mobilizing transposase RayT